MKKVYCVVLVLISSLQIINAEDLNKDARAIILNIIPGFGLGSLYQGDSCGQKILLITDSVSTMTFGIGATLCVFGSTVFLVEGISTLWQGPFDDTPNKLMDIGEPLMYTGLIMYGISKITGVVLPIIYNNRLKEIEINRKHDETITSSDHRQNISIVIVKLEL